MSDVLALIERLEAATETARQATRETHAAIKDLKAVTKEAREAKTEIVQLVRDEVHAIIKEEIRLQLEVLAAATEKQMRKSVEKVSAEFGRLERLFLGKERGKEPLEDLIRRAAAARAAAGIAPPAEPVVIACPSCGRSNDQHEHVVRADPPAAGDFTVCFACGEPAVFEASPEGQLVLRKLTPFERTVALRRPEIAEVRGVVTGSVDPRAALRKLRGEA